MIDLPDEFQLVQPAYSFETPDDPAALLYVEQVKTLQEKMYEETLYIKFIDGDRKGAIAKVIPQYPDRKYPCEISYSPGYSSWDKKRYKFHNEHLFGYATWADIKRKNKVQVFRPNRDVVFLPNYTGPSVWALFDHKAAKAEALKNPDQTDIDGNVLAIGDPVIYINARYGSGMELCHGTIKEFKASVDSRKKEIWTIVTSTEGVESKISNSSYMIYKKA